MAWRERLRDASNPSTIPTSWKGAVAGYLPSPHTPHTWTAKEWHRFRTHRKLPIYVASVAVGATPHPRDEAFHVLRALWDHGVPHGAAVVLDMETAVHASFVNQFAEILHWGNYVTWVYGSASTVFKNPHAGGYWVAQYTGKPFMHNGSNVRATQYASGKNYDSSTVKPWSRLHRLKIGWTPRS